MNSYILLGIIGSVSSIVSLLLAAPNMKSRIFHAIYGFLLTLIVGSAFIYNHSTQEALNIANQELQQIRSLKSGASQLAESYSLTSDVGKNRGFILTSFAFLESNQTEFPKAFKIAEDLVLNGLKITSSAGSIGTDGSSDERKRMEDGAETMRALLRGLAIGKDTYQAH